MDPISAMTGIASLVGMGMQFFGSRSASSAASAMSNTENSILRDEEQENMIRQQAMNLSAQRQQTQNIRNTQRARAMGIAASVSQGAQLGSGTAGGQGQAAAQGAVNTQGIVENQDIGNRIFGVDFGIDQLKGQLGQEQTSLFNAQGMMSMGSSITQGAGAIGRVGANVGGSAFGALNNFFAPNLGFP